MGVNYIAGVAVDEAQRLVFAARIQGAVIEDAVARRIGDDPELSLALCPIAIDERITLLRDGQLLDAKAARKNGSGVATNANASNRLTDS